eukprot:CAMPEP_0114428130 /NCGR_PEP_ID=MMETSP0103-20121206/8756_1 /TAXON_ID=37642 ORGANISM="Paraphysomonas imperforata, Strain PA2" /NCGR_SAMPLE_ID=MMETSP0103 /ASSEMBLY_ACC=CAM_ASM_000201 /LENGTH=152 /DNA_ID=CAMNT_0001597315 /DNA_START=123 /DNA_END=581 /DNA_ORIENTATION=-
MPNSRTVREDLRWLRESAELPVTQQSLRAIQEASSGVLRDLDALTRSLARSSGTLTPPEVIAESTLSGHREDGGGVSTGSGCVLGLQKAVRLARSSSPLSFGTSGDETDALTQCGGTSEDFDEERSVQDCERRESNEGQPCSENQNLRDGGG